jgi:hypothetical protein
MGFILDPESTIDIGIFDKSNAVFEIIAGVGFPSGVAGIVSIHLHLP